MPTSDGRIGHRDLCTSAVVERTIGPASVSSLKIAASLQSDNFVSGSAGWKIERDTGSAEFQDVTVRGTLNADDITAGTLDVDRIATASITTAKLEVTASLVVGQTIESTTFTAGSAGWQIDADGSAEFDNVIVRGTIEASSLEGNLTLGTGGVFRTASSGQRVEITDADFDKVLLYTGDSFEAEPGDLLSAVLSSGSSRVLATSLQAPVTTGDTGGMVLSVRSESFDDSAQAPMVFIDYQSGGGSTQTPRLQLDSQVILVNSVGSASAPSYTFFGDLDTGIFRVGANALGISTGGSRRWRWTNDQFLADTLGTATLPTLAWSADSNTGIYRFGANQIGFTTGGTVRLVLSTTALLPQGDNALNLGTSARRWVDVWAVDGSINTSDAAGKKHIGPLRFDSIRFLKSLPASQFKRRRRNRWHTGFIAQDVKATLDEMGIDLATYIKPPTDDAGLRMSELLAILWDAAQQLETRLTTLEAA